MTLNLVNDLLKKAGEEEIKPYQVEDFEIDKIKVPSTGKNLETVLEHYFSNQKSVDEHTKLPSDLYTEIEKVYLEKRRYNPSIHSEKDKENMIFWLNAYINSVRDVYWIKQLNE